MTSAFVLEFTIKLFEQDDTEQRIITLLSELLGATRDDVLGQRLVGFLPFLYVVTAR